MNISFSLPADAVAENIVRYFQANGFAGISEAFIIRVRPKTGDRDRIDAAFETAHEQEQAAPVHEYFEINPFGFYSDVRNFTEAGAAFQTDFTDALRMELPRLCFDDAPVVIDDSLAVGTKYDVMMKLTDNMDGYAIGILLNDPDASFLDYIGTRHGGDWQQLMDNLTGLTVSLPLDIKLF